MKYRDSNIGDASEFGPYIKKTISDLLAGRLVVEGKSVTLPATDSLSYKVKYEEAETGNSFNVKISWGEPVEAETEAEEAF